MCCIPTAVVLLTAVGHVAYWYFAERSLKRCSFVQQRTISRKAFNESETKFGIEIHLFRSNMNVSDHNQSDACLQYLSSEGYRFLNNK